MSQPRDRSGGVTFREPTLIPFSSSVLSHINICSSTPPEPRKKSLAVTPFPGERNTEACQREVAVLPRRHPGCYLQNTVETCAATRGNSFTTFLVIRQTQEHPMKLSSWLRSAVGLSLIVLALASPAYAGAPLPGVPEIDPGSIVGAMALLSGGILMITDRIRRK
jgi:hypothetical protein